MITDITAIELTPGNNGRDCLANGTYFYENDEQIECCCDECNYMMCCLDGHSSDDCNNCNDKLCPRKALNKNRQKLPRPHCHILLLLAVKRFELFYQIPIANRKTDC